MFGKKEFKVTGIKPSELERLVYVVSNALIIPTKEHKKILEHLRDYGLSSLRAIRDGNKIIGGLQILNWGLYFGGRGIPAAGISVVGIAPEYRRVGAASTLMAETVRELYDQGVEISALFPANIPLYRKSGYEIAMEWCKIILKLRDIPLRNMDLDIVRYKGKNTKDLENVYRRFASATNGNIDRTRFEWKNIIHSRWGPKRVVYLIKRGKDVEGYVILPEDVEERTTTIYDCCVLSRDATERLITFLADYSTMVEKAKFYGSRTDPLLQLIPNSAYEFKEMMYCMLRIVSVPKALAARGYPVGLEAEIHLEVEDNIIKQNSGRYVLKVKDGAGSVRKGGDGKVKIDVRSLAQLFSGFLSPMELRLGGTIEGSDGDLERLAPIFAGPRPWIRDMF